jgi:hypothetical protein
MQHHLQRLCCQLYFLELTALLQSLLLPEMLLLFHLMIDVTSTSNMLQSGVKEATTITNKPRVGAEAGVMKLEERLVNIEKEAEAEIGKGARREILAGAEVGTARGEILAGAEAGTTRGEILAGAEAGTAGRAEKEIETEVTVENEGEGTQTAGIAVGVGAEVERGTGLQAGAGAAAEMITGGADGADAIARVLEVEKAGSSVNEAQANVDMSFLLQDLTRFSWLLQSYIGKSLEVQIVFRSRSQISNSLSSWSCAASAC